MGKTTFRQWWQRPRRSDDRIEHRQVSFLELFYDLVYVALIARLSHTLAHDITWHSVGTYSFVFILIWWAWINGTYYHDLHGNNDLRTRVFTFLQLFGVVGMAVFVTDTYGEGAAGFAISYAYFLAVLTYLWWRTGVHDRNHAPYSRPYSAAFLFSTMMILLSAFFPEWRNLLWSLALIVSLSLPLALSSIGRRQSRKSGAEALSMTPSSALVERFGLFTIIVLGEVVVGVVNGSDAGHFQWRATILGVLLAIGIWWAYFDLISLRKPRAGLRNFYIWYYLHLPLTMSIAALGTALLLLLAGHTEDNGLYWLITGSVVCILFCIGALSSAVEPVAQAERLYRISRRILWAAAAGYLLLSLFHISITGLFIASIPAFFIPVLVALTFWIAGLSTSDES